MSPADLPAPLAEPLHLLQPSPWPDRLLWIALALLAALALRWWLQRPRPTAPAAVPEAVVADAPTRAERSIDEIRRRYDVRGKYRDGLHALAEAIRRHLATLGHPSTTWTARDIAERAGDPALGQLAHRLAHVRFGRREPERREFHELCDLTRSTLVPPPPHPRRSGGDEDENEEPAP